VKEAVIHGMGVGFVLDREIGQDSRLVAVDIEGDDLTAGEYLFRQTDLAELDSVRSFLDVAEAVYPAGGTRPRFGGESPPLAFHGVTIPWPPGGRKHISPNDFSRFHQGVHPSD
jgi:hypothetical protein